MAKTKRSNQRTALAWNEPRDAYEYTETLAMCALSQRKSSEILRTPKKTPTNEYALEPNGEEH